MRKIIVISFVSLDGVMQAPGGPDEDTSGGFTHGGWIVPYFDEFLGNVMTEQMSLENSELLLGRNTYEIFARYWPFHAEDWLGINDVTKYVVSSNPSYKASWDNSKLLTGNIVKKLEQMKNESGPDLHVWGSSNLIHTLMMHHLIDELWLKIFPVTLCGGKRLFGEGTTATEFKMTHNTISPLGVIVANYTHVGKLRTGSVTD